MSEPKNIRTKSFSDISEQTNRIWRAAGGSNMSTEGRTRWERAVNAMGRYRGNIKNTPEFQRNETEIDNIFNGRSYGQLTDAEKERVNELFDENMQRRYSRSVYARRNNRL